MIVEDAAPAEPPSNSERMLKHLKDDAFSTRLVQAYGRSQGDIGALKKVVTARLEQVRQDLVSKD